MELICVEKYNDIRFTLEVGDSTSKVSYLTDEEIAQLIADYPEKFERVGKKDSDEGLVIETKVPKVETQKVKLTKK